MVSLMRRRSCSAAWFAVLALGLAACSGDGHPIRVESIDLADGDYYELAWGGTQEERFYAVARRGAPDGEPVIWTANRPEPCSLGDQVAEYRPVTPRGAGKYVVGAPTPAWLEVYDFPDPDNPTIRSMGFSDLDCARSDMVIADLPSNPRDGHRYPARIYEPDLMSMKYLHLTPDQTAELADPWTGDRTTIASDVTSYWDRGTNAWFVEDGQWVKRDSDGHEVARHGHDVSSLTLLGDNGDVAYTKIGPPGDNKGGDLYVVRSSKEKKLAELACKQTPVDGLVPGALAFFSPCEDSRLTIARSDGKLFSYESGVDQSYFALQGRLLFRIDREATTEIWMIQSGNLERATKQFELPRWSGGPSIWTGRGGAIYIAAPQLADSRLSIWRVRFDGANAGFEQVGSDILRVVPNDQGTVRLQGDGSLIVTDANNTTVAFRVQGAAPDFYTVFSQLQPALVYRTNVDPETQLGHLAIHFFSGDHFEISDDVREWTEVGWPERGILYTTGGATPKLRFARAEIPCQATSSAPWACNF
jgi:hypothetical protein